MMISHCEVQVHISRSSVFSVLLVFTHPYEGAVIIIIPEEESETALLPSSFSHTRNLPLCILQQDMQHFLILCRHILTDKSFYINIIESLWERHLTPSCSSGRAQRLMNQNVVVTGRWEHVKLCECEQGVVEIESTSLREQLRRRADQQKINLQRFDWLTV